MFGVKLKENFKVESPNDSTESFLTCITNFPVLVWPKTSQGLLFVNCQPRLKILNCHLEKDTNLPLLCGIYFDKYIPGLYLELLVPY